MLTTLLVSGAIITGVAVAVKMVKDTEGTLEHHQRLMDIEREIEHTNDKLLFYQF
jgi:hypothetical protein